MEFNFFAYNIHLFQKGLTIMKTSFKVACLLTFTLLISACTAEKTPQNETTSMAKKLSKGEKISSASCSKCHNSSVYTRADRKVKSLSLLTARVQKCNAKTGAGLDEEELEALTLFLNTSYYKFTK